MNTDCLVTVSAPGCAAAEQEAWQARRIVAAYERAYSRFQSDSELSRLNASPEERVHVSARLAALLARCLEDTQLTGGVFDPLVLSELEALGYARSFELVTAGPAAGPSLVRRRERRCGFGVDAAQGLVRRPPGCRIDLGGIAKGAAADEAAARLRAFEGALVDLGGDIRVHGRPADAPHWLVAIDDPRSPGGAPLAVLQLNEGAVATSSILKRSWAGRGVRVHHIIDPRSGQPARSGVLQCSVLADCAEHAEVAAKAGLILGLGVVSEADKVGSALGLRGIACLTEDGKFRRSGGWLEASWE